VLLTGISGLANVQHPTVDTVRNIPPVLFRCQYLSMQATSSVTGHEVTPRFAGSPGRTARLQARFETERTGFSRTASFDGFILVLRGMYSRFQNHSARELRAHLEGQADERLRIARELHDTLLQTFHGLLPQFQAARNICRMRPEEAEQLLDSALDQADAAIAEGREAIQNMRSSTEISSDLAQSLGKVAKEFESENCARFGVIVEGSPRDLHPDIRHEVYRISCEAIRNAFQHAAARAIEAEIRYSNSLRVRIRDDGKGIDSGKVKPAREGGLGHYGLVGMRERAAQIGANLTVWSALGAGTEIELSIPGSIAYGTCGTGTHTRLFRRRGSQADGL